MKRQIASLSMMIILLMCILPTARATSEAACRDPSIPADRTSTWDPGARETVPSASIEEPHPTTTNLYRAAVGADHPRGQGMDLKPANPNASVDAAKVLNYLASLPSKEGKRVIVGQNLRHVIYAVESGYDDYVVTLHNSTGKWVGMVGAGYGEGCTPDQISTGNKELIEYWNRGHLITIWYPVNNPWTGGSRQDLTNRNLVELITPGTAVNETWMAELDKVAEGLAELRDAGVVVLWRPFHEMTFRNTFWWDVGAHPGDPEPFKEMWRHMFNYFTYTKGLNNLLWVYAAADTDSYSPVDFPYPGDEYVDVVGIDVYSDSTTIRGDGYNKLVALGKPFALTEVGSRQIRDGTFDNMTVINAIKERYPATSYVLYWHSWTNNKLSIVENRNAAALMNDPWVITRDDLDWQSEPTFPLAPEELIIDNINAGFSAQGAWQEYTQVGGPHYGDSHYFHKETGTGQDIATWSFTVPRPGYYQVYAWWVAGEYRPFDVPYTIHHSGGSATVKVDQRVDGSRWNLLGTFYFQGEGSIAVSDDVSAGRDVVADAVRLVYHSIEARGEFQQFLPLVVR